ncbi:MAG: hypothetical protein IT378_18825 [Sandaracinaceae bacterium]|nr:hypothetical protein [Sandaracinaceae bacterium]
MRSLALSLALLLAWPVLDVSLGAGVAHAQRSVRSARARRARLARARRERAAREQQAELPPDLVALDREAPPPMDVSDHDIRAARDAERRRNLDPELLDDERPGQSAPREPARYTPLDTRVSIRAFERTLSYLGLERGRVTDYMLPIGFGARFAADYYPGAHLTNDALAHLGVGLDMSHSLFVQSTGANGVSYPTNAYNWMISLRARVPLDASGSEIAFEAGGGETGFRVERGSLAQPGPEGVPATDYDVFRFAASGRFAIGEAALTARAGYLPALGTGRMGTRDFFPGASAHGVEAAIGLRYALGLGFEFHAEAELRLFVLLFGNPPTADNVASGAIDQSIAVDAGLAWRMPAGL